MKCPNCGNEVRDGAKFCPSCGAAVTDGSGRHSRQPDPVGPPAAAGGLPIRNILIGIGTFVLTLVVAGAIGVKMFGLSGTSAQTETPATATDAGDTNDSGEADTSSSQPADTTFSPANLRPAFLATASANVDDFTPSVEDPAVEPGLANVFVPSEYYLSKAQLEKLEQQRFVVDSDSWGDEFYPTYERNRYAQCPNFVTVDSMMHTYHLYFQYLLKGLERTSLSNSLASLSSKMLAASAQQLETLSGSEWEAAARRNATFFGVAQTLLGSQDGIPDAVASDVQAEVDRIMQASGSQDCSVTGKPLDYTQFIVRGYYEGDPTLEAYFRAMMWYGQLSFFQNDEDLDRSALLMTLGLQGDALSDWEAIYAVTGFFVGASDDNGYYEYQQALAEAYGADVSVASLAGNDGAWQTFHALTGEMPTPQINSLPGSSARDTEAQRGFRFMGQRFSVDSQVFQQLIYDNVGESSSGERRLLPDALDVPAAFGSDEALEILQEQGAGSFAGYDENMQGLRTQVSSTGDDFWRASLYNQWLDTLRPLLEPKGSGYPAFMQSDQWTRKALESFLGSYTELKHDTVLYTKQAAAEGDGSIPENPDDRGYVEPEPVTFARLSSLCKATAEGLDRYGMLGDAARDDLAILQQLSDQLATIARKELLAELPTDEEFELIRSIGVQLEHFWKEVYEEEAERTGNYLSTQQFPAALVVDVANGDGSCLELATGRVRTLYVIVAVEGSLRVASGPVFSFYQFEQPSSERLTDPEWRDLLRGSWQNPSEKTTSPAWTSGYTAGRL